MKLKRSELYRNAYIFDISKVSKIQTFATRLSDYKDDNDQ